MDTASLARLIPYLRRLAMPRDSDGELLGRFVLDRDEDAVCRQFLRQQQPSPRPATV
jgi:hypothetical protein